MRTGNRREGKRADFVTFDEKLHSRRDSERERENSGRKVGVEGGAAVQVTPTKERKGERHKI